MAFCIPNRRILIVDDNVDIHRDFEKILRTRNGERALDKLEQDLFGNKVNPKAEEHYEIACASSGVDALELVRRAKRSNQEFKVAFVDMRMPGWDGIETIEQLWRVQPDLQVAICSAYMDYSWYDVIQRLKRPGLRLIRKPWTSAEILGALHELCGRQ